MPNELTVTEKTTISELDPATLESLIVNGDCSKLTPTQRVAYYRARCDAAGLDYRTQPLQFINLQGKLVLYALKGATDQLAANHGIVCEIIDQRTESGVRTVTVRSRTRDGRQTDDAGCVSIEGKKGDDLCNAFLKAITKAKRRAVLSLCGLGMLDESEIETIPAEARKEAKPATAAAPKPTYTLKPAPPVNAPPTEEEMAEGLGLDGEGPLDDNDPGPSEDQNVTPIKPQNAGKNAPAGALPTDNGIGIWGTWFVTWRGEPSETSKGGMKHAYGFQGEKPTGGSGKKPTFASLFYGEESDSQRVAMLDAAKKSGEPIQVCMEKNKTFFNITDVKPCF